MTPAPGEEFSGQQLWFGPTAASGFAAPELVAVLTFALGVVTVVWLPRAAAATAVFGIMLFGLVGALSGFPWFRSSPFAFTSGFVPVLNGGFIHSTVWCC